MLAESSVSSVTPDSPGVSRVWTVYGSNQRAEQADDHTRLSAGVGSSGSSRPRPARPSDEICEESDGDYQDQRGHSARHQRESFVRV